MLRRPFTPSASGEVQQSDSLWITDGYTCFPTTASAVLISKCVHIAMLQKFKCCHGRYYSNAVIGTDQRMRKATNAHAVHATDHGNEHLSQTRNSHELVETAETAVIECFRCAVSGTVLLW